MISKISRRSLLMAAAGAVGATALPPVFAVQGSVGKAADELLDYDALGLAHLIRSGQVSQREVLAASIARIEALDGKLNAMTTRTFARALERVDQISPDTVFAGVPTVFKDLIDVGGVRRTSGSLMHLTNVPKTSVEYVKAAERAGLNMLGMTNTPEFASTALTDNLAFGATRNPWNLDHSAGGSSGGSGAAVAAGYVPLAHGTDGGGSNRIPAACCGVLGMKASRYRQVSGEPDGGHLFLRTHQSLSRTVRDSAALLAVTENPNNQAGYPPVGLVDGPGKRRLRIAFTAENCFGRQAAAPVREALEKTVQLCTSLGHEVEEVPYPVDGSAMFQAVEGIMLANMPRLLAMVESLTGKRAEDARILTPAMVDIGRYSQTLPADAHKRGISWFERASAEFAGFFTRYDVWLTPTLPMEAPEVGYIGPDTPWNLAHERNRELMSYTALINGIGAPAMSVPLFHSSATGLPIGSHFVAAPGADRSLYELAFELESAKPWGDRWAPHSAKFKD